MSESRIRLIVGLGNPGPDYAQTRHNAGFWAVDRWADRLGASLQPNKNFFGEAGSARHRGQAIWLLKPQTFMNRSGQSVSALAKFYKFKPEEILVIHDELDLLPGQVRLKFGGGHAGHNGLRDIQSALGGPGFWRLRLGIGHPRSLGLQQNVVDFVLHRPRQRELEALLKAIDRSEQVIDRILDSEMEKAMSELHRDTPMAQDES
ncbi:aminoacyl-tRNA hydrolase [Orrella sp. 11846]|uniref:aminoacyl-tRNA hydrolase n=1 Tax=Orrella sp. 11846 TaxID=3409913 RepID=UPI003B591B8C